MHKKLIGIMVAVLLTAGLTAGCPVPKEGATLPEVLRLGAGWGEHPEEVKAKWKLAVEYLKRELGIPVEVFVGTDYTAVIEAMRAKKIEFAWYGPFGYIMAAERANAEAIAALANEEGVPVTYHSYIITHPGTGLKSMEDVKRRSKELTLAFVDPASTSGHLIPRGYLLSIGINPDKDFKEVIFAGSHAEAALAVKAKKVDIAAQCVHFVMIKEGKIGAEEVVELWESPPIPPSPIAVRGDLDTGLKKRIQQTFVDMAKKDPEAFKAVAWKPGQVRFTAVDDSLYDELRVIARALGYIK